MIVGKRTDREREKKDYSYKKELPSSTLRASNRSQCPLAIVSSPAAVRPWDTVPTAAVIGHLGPCEHSITVVSLCAVVSKMNSKNVYINIDDVNPYLQR